MNQKPSRASSQSLVSIIIPCYNAEKWLDETITSCLEQSYRPIQIIPIDDGSTDGSLDIIRRYAQRYPDLISYEAQSNSGAPAARNRGFELSRGDYVQWLDADDLLAPEKLQHQIPVLESGRADIVTGQWRNLVEKHPGVFVKDPIYSPVVTEDPVLSLIDTAGWSPNNTYLMARSVVEAVGGWHEDMSCLQDVDFMVRVAMTGARFSTVPQLCGYYRRLLRDTVSTRDQVAFMQNTFNIYEIVYGFCEQTGWTEERRRILSRCYGWVARYFFEHDRGMFDRCMERIGTLDPNYAPDEPIQLRWLTKVFGYRNAEQIALWYRRGKRVALD